MLHYKFLEKTDPAEARRADDFFRSRAWRLIVQHTVDGLTERLCTLPLSHVEFRDSYAAIQTERYFWIAELQRIDNLNKE